MKLSSVMSGFASSFDQLMFPRFQEKKTSKGQTQAGLDRIEAAEVKRQRKNAKRAKDNVHLLADG